MKRRNLLKGLLLAPLAPLGAQAVKDDDRVELGVDPPSCERNVETFRIPIYPEVGCIINFTAPVAFREPDAVFEHIKLVTYVYKEDYLIKVVKNNQRVVTGHSHYKEVYDSNGAIIYDPDRMDRILRELDWECKFVEEKYIAGQELIDAFGRTVGDIRYNKIHHGEIPTGPIRIKSLSRAEGGGSYVFS